MWNDQILSKRENETGKAINLSISLWTRTLSPLFSSYLTFLLLSKWWLHIRAKKFQRTRSLFFSEVFIGVAVVGSYPTTRTATRPSKTTIDLISKTTTLHLHNTFFYISCPFLHDYDVKMPNFASYVGRKQATTNFISLSEIECGPLKFSLRRVRLQLTK